MDPQLSPSLSPSELPPQELAPEVSMVEASDVTGVSFTPELWMQRRAWALEVLRREGARSVLDVGCGPGALLETLVIPPTTIQEPPILPRRSKRAEERQLLSPDYSDEEEIYGQKELLLTRLGGLDTSPSILSSALSLLTPTPSPTSPSSSAIPTTSTIISSTPPIIPYVPGTTPRWEPLTTELYFGGIEKYNAKLEDYDAIVMLEVIEHLEPSVLSRFGVVTLGTYRPRLLLVTTPNFDFNAKFPRAKEEGFAKKGFVDPTGRTERVFRHSDHKVEMTSEEFRSWAEASAADWGYSVEVSGVGISSIPSYYPPQDEDDPEEPRRPIYATQTAIFRLASGLPTRSPRSVRSVELPFMPSSKESMHPHKLVGRFIHPISAPSIVPYPVAASPAESDSKAHKAEVKAIALQNRTPEAAEIVREKVEKLFEQWKTPKVSLSELWGVPDIAGACRGSKRYLVGCLGGYGDCPEIIASSSSTSAEEGTGSKLKSTVGSWLNTAKNAVSSSSSQAPSESEKPRERLFTVLKDGTGLAVIWEGYQPPKKASVEEWGVKDLKIDDDTKDSNKAGGW